MGGVDHAVLPHQAQTDLGGLGEPRTPGRVEVRDVRDPTLESLLARPPLTLSLRLDLSEPNLEGGVKVFPCQLQHGRVSAASQLEQQNILEKYFSSASHLK